MWAKWPIKKELIPVSVAWSEQQYFYRPPPPPPAPHRRVTTLSINSPVPIYTPGWREAPWEQSVWQERNAMSPASTRKPEPLYPKRSALTIRPPRLRHYLLVTVQSKKPLNFDLIRTGQLRTHNHNKVQDSWTNLKTTNQITVAVCGLLLMDNFTVVYLVTWLLNCSGAAVVTSFWYRPLCFFEPDQHYTSVDKEKIYLKGLSFFFNNIS